MTYRGTSSDVNGVLSEDEHHHAASETTPLLATGSVAPAADPDAADATTATGPPGKPPAEANGEAGGSGDGDGKADKPLPKRQIFLLCYARLVEPIAFFSIFPYVNQMVQDNGRLPDADVGFYSGLIESLFSLTQMLVMLLWGRAADRAGRKPVLVVSLVGVSVATALFGFAHTLWQMILFRCAAGVFSGTIVTIRTMIAEHSTPRTQARSFSWFAFAGNLGIFAGPLIGGALADPAHQYPGSLFGRGRFFLDYPYALSSIAVGCIGLTAAMTSALFIEETLPAALRRRGKIVGSQDNTNGSGNGEGENGNVDEDGDGSTTGKPGQPSSTWELLQSPGVGAALYNYGHVMLLAFAYTAVVPVFWFTSPQLGGLGLSPLQISLLMGLTGLSQAAWLLLVFPPLQKRLGTNGVMRACGAAYPVFLGIMPLFNAILRIGGDTDAGRAVFWTLVPVCLALGPGVSMAFTAAQLALNDVSPSPATLGTLNALALTGASALRAFAPALFTSLFAVGVRRQLLAGYFVWAVLVVLAAGFTVATRYLPPQSEKAAEDAAGDERVA